MQHITLNTGHIRQSPKHEVADDIMPIMQELLATVLAGGHAAMPGFEGITINGAAQGHCLLATVWDRAEVPLVTVGVAAEPECGAELWQMLHAYTEQHLVTDQAEQPPVPWCAARMEISSIARPDTVSWLGDFERCLAWAWLERQ